MVRCTENRLARVHDDHSHRRSLMGVGMGMAGRERIDLEMGRPLVEAGRAPSDWSGSHAGMRTWTDQNGDNRWEGHTVIVNPSVGMGRGEPEIPRSSRHFLWERSLAALVFDCEWRHEAFVGGGWFGGVKSWSEKCVVEADRENLAARPSLTHLLQL